jgi:hypothetical protein
VENIFGTALEAKYGKELFFKAIWHQNSVLKYFVD